MTRLYHSPSSLALGLECPAKWAWRYLAGVRDPEPEWSTYAAGLPANCGHDPRLFRRGICRKCSKQRSKALGKAVHAISEARYTDEPVRSLGFPAEVWSSGEWMLPHPDDCVVAEVEAEIGQEPITDERFTRAMRVGPILVAGKRDLTVRLRTKRPSRCAPVDFDPTDWWLIDLKTTKSIAKYAKSPSDLLDDLQCNAYALDLMRRYKTQRQPCRWAYFETGQARRAVPADVVIELQRAEDLVGAVAEWAARELDPLERVQDALCNVAACGEYGGCDLHESVGGPCKAKRRTGALIQALTRAPSARGGKEKLKMTPEQKAERRAKYAHLQPPTGGAAAPAETAAPAESQASAETESAESTAPPGRTRARRGRKPAAVTATAAAPIDAAATEIDSLIAERDSAVTRVVEIETKLAALRDRIAGALSDEGQAQ